MPRLLYKGVTSPIIFMFPYLSLLWIPLHTRFFALSPSALFRSRCPRPSPCRLPPLSRALPPILSSGGSSSCPTVSYSWSRLSHLNQSLVVRICLQVVWCLRGCVCVVPRLLGLGVLHRQVTLHLSFASSNSENTHMQTSKDT